MKGKLNEIEKTNKHKDMIKTYTFSRNKQSISTGIIDGLGNTIITLSIAIIALVIYLKTKKVTKFPESEKAS